MQTTVGNVFPASIVDGGAQVATLDAGASSRTISFPTDAFLTLFERVGVKEGDPTSDLLGIYSRMNVGRDMKARLAFFTKPNSLLSARTPGCTWKPKGGVRMQTDTIDTYPIVYDGEQCPDQIFGECFERLFGTGTNVYDVLGTPEGRALFQQMLNAIYLGLGNSAMQLALFGNHPAIEVVNNNGKHNLSAEAWEDYYDQQTSTNLSGIITILDDLNTSGVPGFDVPLPDTDFNAAGQYTGNIINLIESLKAAAGYEFSAIINGEFAPGAPRPIILLTDALFNAYRNYLITLYNANPATLAYQLQGPDGQLFRMHNVLDYFGLPVVRWTASEAFDNVCGTKAHRAALLAPGAFGIAYSGDFASQYEGMGLIVEQRLDLPHKGKVFMHTTFRLGAAVAKDFVTYAANVQVPV